MATSSIRRLAFWFWSKFSFFYLIRLFKFQVLDEAVDRFLDYLPDFQPSTKKGFLVISNQWLPLVNLYSTACSLLSLQKTG